MSKTRVVTINDSSQIKNISYDLSSKTMQVKFSNGTMYMYVSVPPAVFGALVSAESVGSHFARHIRDAFPGTKVEM
jgi:frataxin-like iron-binding protein CyaY